MPTPVKTKKAMTVRFGDHYTYELVCAAARMQEQSVSSFIMSAVRSYSENVLRERAQSFGDFGPIVLSPADYKALMDSMKNPPQPNQALAAAFEDFKRSGITFSD
ncbi:MAG: DUF1778 domain-containing protein [Treponema sp.]|nr:DUF1778 domain-containing protein [Treponema sp.]